MFESIGLRRRLVTHLASYACLIVGVSVVTGCASLFDESRNEVVYEFDFEQSDQKWVGGFADYPTTADEEQLDLTFEYRAMPEATNGERMGLFLGGSNISDDLFMYVKNQISQLQPSTTYEVRYTLRLASNAPSGCSGVGGAPGESVFLKGGASVEEPVAVEEDEQYRMNIEKGNQSQGGTNVVVIGTIENGSRQCQNTPYEMITRHSQNDPLTITTDENGALWLFVGTDSGFEGRTELYFDSIQIRLRLR